MGYSGKNKLTENGIVGGKINGLWGI